MMAAWDDTLRWSDSDRRDDTLEARAHIDFDGCTDYDWDGTLGETGGVRSASEVGLEPLGETTAYAPVSPSVSDRRAASLLLRGVERVITKLEEAA